MIGYIAAMLDRSGYIGLVMDKTGRIRPEASITTKNKKVSKRISKELSRLNIRHRIKVKTAYKGGIQYESYQIVVGRFWDLNKLCTDIGPAMIDQSRISILHSFIISRTTKNKGSYTSEEIDMQEHLSKINKLHKKLR